GGQGGSRCDVWRGLSIRRPIPLAPAWRSLLSLRDPAGAPHAAGPPDQCAPHAQSGQGGVFSRGIEKCKLQIANCKSFLHHSALSILHPRSSILQVLASIAAPHLVSRDPRLPASQTETAIHTRQKSEVTATQ